MSKSYKNYWHSMNVCSKPKNFKWVKRDNEGVYYSYNINILDKYYYIIDNINITIKKNFKDSKIDKDYTIQTFFKNINSINIENGYIKRDGDFFEIINKIFILDENDINLYHINKKQKSRVDKLNNIFSNE